MKRRTLITAGLAAAPSLLLAPASFAVADEELANLKELIEPLKPEIEPLKPEIEPLETTQRDGDSDVITLNSDILFEFGKFELTAAAQAKVGELVKDLPQGAAVRVEGHTDSVPSDMGNDVLSQKRAQAVADAITAARPDLTLHVKGFGDTKPLEPNEQNGEDNPEGRAKNRRVEIRYGS